MPLAKDISIELRKVADALDLNPDVEVTRPNLSFPYFGGQKEKFMENARILPRPVSKEIPKTLDGYDRVRVIYTSDALTVDTSIYRKDICVLIEPAKPAVFECALTLLDHEEEALTA
jgi:hypothetical protein